MGKNIFKDVFAKNSITCHFSILLLIFSLIITSSVAWFTANRIASTDNLGMTLEVDDTSAIYRAYIFDLDTEKGINTKLVDGELTEINVTNLDLNQYDTLFRARNKYTPAFAQIKLLSKESMPQNGTVHLTIEALTEGLEEGKNEYTSNIARFTALIIPGTKDANPPDVAITDPDELYKFISTDQRYDDVAKYKGEVKADSITISNTFITVTGEEGNHTHERASSITVSAKYSENDWYIDESGHKALNVYLYITYDVQLIDCYFGELFGDEILDLNSAGIVFDNDLKNITISYDK